MKILQATLEYAPNLYRDGAAEWASRSHPYFAGRVYASERIEMRRSGNSGGALLGEYRKSQATRSRLQNGPRRGPVARSRSV
ncbi:MAG: hypothetical protein OXI87_06480 [Albidovulum sp.]|nr:hypothetical protein [Albidovulum sp.]MDE0304518.1 hypothetical protein [Albidovulum sp.]